MSLILPTVQMIISRENTQYCPVFLFVSGYPAPQVTWYKDDVQLDRYCGLPKYEIFRNGQNHSLHIYKYAYSETLRSIWLHLFYWKTTELDIVLSFIWKKHKIFIYIQQTHYFKMHYFRQLIIHCLRHAKLLTMKALCKWVSWWCKQVKGENLFESTKEQCLMLDILLC